MWLESEKCMITDHKEHDYLLGWCKVPVPTAFSQLCFLTRLSQFSPHWSFRDMMYKHSFCLTDPLHSYLTFPPAKLWQQLPQPSCIFPLFLYFHHSLTYRRSSESTEKTMHGFQNFPTKINSFPTNF